MPGKTSISLVGLVIVLLIGAACGGSPAVEKTEVSSSGSIDQNGKIMLEFWYSLGGDTGKVVEALVSQFNESQSEVTVNPTYQGEYAAIMAKIWAAISSGKTPNVAQLGAAPLLGETGAIVPISDYLEPGGFDRSQVWDVFWQYNTAGGTLWSMPFNNSVPVLYYNRDLFAAAGLDPDQPPQTWDQVIEYGKQLTRDTDNNNEIDQWGINTHENTHWYLSTLFLGNGAQIVNPEGTEVLYDSPEAVQMLQLWSDLVNVEKIMPPNQHSEARADFLAGKLGMLLNSSSSIFSMERDASFKVGVAVIPAVAGREPVIPIGGGSLVILKQEDEKIQQAAWEFVRFMASEESALELATKTGYLPIYSDLLDSPEFKAYLSEHPNVKASTQSLDYAVSIPEFSALGTSDSALRGAVEQVELGEADPRQALEAAKAAVQQSIQEQPQP